eukprot:scaffold5221_cov88-Cylindrotheca_fusiformis.AAC.7
MELIASSAPVDPERFFVYTSRTKDEDIPKETLTHLRVDSSVRRIPARAFMSCRALLHVQLPETLRTIESYAFQNCSKLKSIQFVEIPWTIPSRLEDGTVVFPPSAKLRIGDGAFAECVSLRKVVICSVSSTRLSWGIFSECKGLLSVELPEGLQVIESLLFDGCESLTAVKIPSSVIRIGNYAFHECGSLASLELPHGLQEIREGSFLWCNSIETLRIPASLSSLGDRAFLDCSGLKYISLPPTLERIEDYVFTDCYRLEYIQIPSTVSFIGEKAFWGCNSLSHIRIPPSVESLVPNAFLECSRLISIELPEEILIATTGGDVPFNVLLNLAIPTLPEDDEVVSGLLYNESRLRSVVDDEAGLRYKLKHRFDNAPLNKLCYYQSYHSPEDAVVQLRSLMEDDPLAATSQVDKFGMTPLHVLSVSQTPNLDMLLTLMNEADVDHLVHGRDLFSSTPLDYLCMNRMPNSIEVIRGVLYTRFDYLLGLNPSWISDMLQAIEEALAVEFSSRRRDVVATYLKLANYELKVIFSLLELRLWKSGGTSVILDNVLLFLDTLDVEDYFSHSPCNIDGL